MLLQEIRHACRMLARSPGFTVVATLSLALGIGTNTALFSLHDALLWRPLPVRDPGSVVTVALDRSDRPPTRTTVSYPNYRDLRADLRSFDGLEAHQLITVSFARSRQAPREIRGGMLVSENFFDVLGVAPALGRGFTASEGQVPGRDAVAVLGYDFWKNALGGDRSAVNSRVVIDGIDFTVVGVAPQTFPGLDAYLRPAFYVPLMMTDRLPSGVTGGDSPAAGSALEDREARSLEVKGRLKPGSSRQAAEAELTARWTDLVQRYPDANRDRALAVRTENQQRRRLDPLNAMIVTIMTTLVAIVLAIACANVANLMLARARARSREIALRLALGVSRLRLLRQLLLESAVLAGLGCALGLAFAYGGIRFLYASLQSTIRTDLIVAPDLHIDTRALVFSLTATAASALLFGLAPAWQGLKTQLVPSLKSAEPGQNVRQRTIGRNVLVIAQVALSMVLLVAAGMLLDGYRRSVNLNPGFRTDHLVTMSTDTALMRYTPVATRTFYRGVMDRALATPGVASATLTSSIPLDTAGRAIVAPDGYRFPRGQTSTAVLAAVVDEHYFSTLKVPVRGRSFSRDDDETAPRVAIVNEAFAHTYWPNQDPIGKRVRLGNGEDVWLTVVGVTPTLRYLQLFEPPQPMLYQPFIQSPRTQMSMLVEATGSDVAALAAPLRGVVAALDIELPVFDVRPFTTLYESRAIGPQLMVIRVVSMIGLLGLTLALIGLYGLVAYSVARRTREIGVRMAMGAQQGDVARMVLRQGLALSLIGIAAGGVASVGVVSLLTSGVAQIASPNAATYMLVPLALVILTLAASYVPARRAAAVDPIRALRCE